MAVNAQRIEQYEKNCELIEMILEHRHTDAIQEHFSEIMTNELEIAMGDILCAYRDGDVDAMITAITGWCFENLAAKAKIIPDIKHYFYNNGEVPSAEITFPLYGKDDWTEQEFLDHIRKSYAPSHEAMSLIQNAISYACERFETKEDRQNFLWSMLRNTIGIDEETVCKVMLGEEG